ncbi:MAG: hypothetical protein AAF799_19965 [Myxococcota bacterium]
MKLRTLALLSAVPLLGALACEQVLSCTDAGCGTLLSISIEGPARDLAAAVYDLELIVDGETLDASCELVDGDFACDPFDNPNPTGLRAEGVRGENDARFILIRTSFDDHEEDERPSTLQLSVWRDGDLVAERMLEPTYETYYPNGEQCGPECERTEELMPVVVP